jgi:hypothetical protein
VPSDAKSFLRRCKHRKYNDNAYRNIEELEEKKKNGIVDGGGRHCAGVRFNDFTVDVEFAETLTGKGNFNAPSTRIEFLTDNLPGDLAG